MREKLESENLTLGRLRKGTDLTQRRKERQHSCDFLLFAWMCESAKSAVMNFKSRCLCLLAIILVQILCMAADKKLPEKYRKAVETLTDSPRFRETGAITNLPSEIVALCADSKGRLAEAGEKWEPTDVISDPSLPSNRLIWAVDADPICVVHFERGGRAHNFVVLVAVYRKESAKPLIGSGDVGAKLKDYKAFVEALRAGKLDNLFESP